MSAPPSWRWTRTGSSWRCACTRWPTWAPICPPSRPACPTYLYATLLAGVYTTPAIYCEVKAVFTNTVPVDAYRGAGRPEATFLLERLVDAVGARHRDRPGRDAPAQLHPGRRVPVSDAGGAAVRQRRLSRDAGRRAEDRPTGPASRRAARRRRRRASCAASASPPISRPAASRRRRWSARSARAPGCTRSPTSACIRPAASPCSPARTATARGTRRPSRSSSPSSSACRSSRSRSCTATPARSRSAWAPTAAAAWRSAARRWSRRWTRSSPRARRSPPI